MQIQAGQIALTNERLRGGLVESEPPLLSSAMTVAVGLRSDARYTRF